MTTAVALENMAVSTRWTVPTLIISFATLSVIGLYWPTVLGMIEVWKSSRTFAHGFLVLPAAGYLVWCHRKSLASLTPVPSAEGVIALFLVGIGWFLGYRQHIAWVQQAAVVTMFPGLVLAILGRQIFWTIAWPLGFLVFMLPIGASIEPWLQDVTAWFILAGLRLNGIPYLYESHRIAIPSGTWEVAPDCGGLRYLLPGLALGYAFAGLIYRKPGRRIVFLIFCAAMLMVANGIRAYGVIIGDHFGFAEGADHRVFSYTVYGLTIPLLCWVGLKWTEHPTIAASFSNPDAVPVGQNTRHIILMSVGVVSLLAVAPLCVWLLEHPR